MKNVALLLVSGILGVMVLAMVMTICGDMNRNTEVRENLSTAMEGALKEVAESETVHGEKELLAGCIGRMALAADADTDLTFEVCQADADKGILALRVAGSYAHPNGMEGETSWERVVIRERKKEEPKMKVCEVSFYMNKEELMEDGDCYKRCVVMDGETVKMPVEPRLEGASFAGWRDSNDYLADFSQPVHGELSYYAAWE